MHGSQEGGGGSEERDVLYIGVMFLGFESVHEVKGRGEMASYWVVGD